MTFNIGIDSLIARIDAILPQTQCRQCGYEGCKPYAEAIAAGEADINLCPPGGDVGIHALADLLAAEYKPLNTEHGEYKPRAIALIDEATCIGCTLCINACPVDAILGATKHMHTVIASECTGCELCLSPCPVDCISMETIVEVSDTLKKEAADLARERYNFKLARIEREKSERTQKYAERTQAKRPETNTSSVIGNELNNKIPDKKAVIAAAIARAKAQKTATA
ncbi:MAG: electron transport complex subunit RsxB [Methylotenera sp.]|nr:electron transport complex subunit RsxB [Methylotenera sp.]